MFVTLNYIKDEILMYEPSTQDLDYPNKLMTQTASSPPQSPEKSNGVDESKTRWKIWLPTLEKTLVCLSRLYLTVDVSWDFLLF